jgi:hypothetical protein
MKELLNKVRGTIEVFNVKDGDWELVHKQHNLVTYQGADILAKAVAGALNINTMYLVFENDAGAIRISEDLGNIAATYAETSSDRGYVRVSTMGEPIYSASTDDYTNNEVVFLGVTDGTSEGDTVEDGTSVFYHTALVAAPDADDQTEDLIFSCTDLTTEISKVAGAQIGIRWTLTFEAPTV